MVRTDAGWVATSLRPRDFDAKPMTVDEGEVLAEVESGDLGLGWATLVDGPR